MSVRFLPVGFRLGYLKQIPKVTYCTLRVEHVALSFFCGRRPIKSTAGLPSLARVGRRALQSPSNFAQSTLLATSLSHYSEKFLVMDQSLPIHKGGKRAATRRIPYIPLSAWHQSLTAFHQPLVLPLLDAAEGSIGSRTPSFAGVP